MMQKRDLGYQPRGPDGDEPPRDTLPPVGSEKYDDLMMEAQEVTAEVRHARGECETGCSLCEAELVSSCFYCGKPNERPDLGDVCNKCWLEFKL